MRVGAEGGRGLGMVWKGRALGAAVASSVWV